MSAFAQGFLYQFKHDWAARRAYGWHLMAMFFFVGDGTMHSVSKPLALIVSGVGVWAMMRGIESARRCDK